MKYLLSSLLFFSMVFYAAATNAEVIRNDVLNSVGPQNGISPEEVNSSPNPAPESEEDFLRNSTLQSKPVQRNISGESHVDSKENAMDYSTTPQKKPKKMKR